MLRSLVTKYFANFHCSFMFWIILNEQMRYAYLYTLYLRQQMNMNLANWFVD